MNLVRKLLRRHISPAQLIGFTLANLLGLWIVLLGFQFYRDIAPIFGAEDGFFNQNYLVVSKRVSSLATLSGKDQTFGPSEIDDLAQQPFCKRLGTFTASRYKASAMMSVGNAAPMQTEIFFEAVPDGFVDAPADVWHYAAGASEVPVILPRSYIALYNFGFAKSRNLPKVSDGVAAMIQMRIFLRSNTKQGEFTGKIVGFSSRVNTILVPQEFMDWSNAEFEPYAEEEPSKLILQVANPADEHIAQYMDEKGLEIDDDKLDAGKATYFLKLIVGLVMFVGLFVCLLSFYILMLSIYLLVQKNATKLESLLLIGYSPMQVGRPYRLLVIGLNVLVFIAAIALLLLCRSYYLPRLQIFFPETAGASLAPTLLLGFAILFVVSLLNCVAIQRKIKSIIYG